jgi:ribosomal protein L9
MVEKTPSQSVVSHPIIFPIPFDEPGNTLPNRRFRFIPEHPLCFGNIGEAHGGIAGLHIHEVFRGLHPERLLHHADVVHQFLLATPGEISKWKNKETQAKFKKDTAAASFASLITVLKKEPVVIAGKKADAKGQLFASIKEMDIVDAIFARTKISLDPKQIKLANPIKSIGKHDINLKQGETIETIAVHIQ